MKNRDILDLEMNGTLERTRRRKTPQWRLLAKPHQTLIDHICTMLKVYHSVKNQYSSMISEDHYPNFWKNLFHAIVLHDWGKAADGFQNMLRLARNTTENQTIPRWGYRHEILSATFVDLLPLQPLDKKIVGMAVITHHKNITTILQHSTINPLSPYLEKSMKKELLTRIKEFSKPAMEELHHIGLMIPTWSKKFLGTTLPQIDLTPLLIRYEDEIARQHSILNLKILKDPFSFFVHDFNQIFPYKDGSTLENLLHNRRYLFFLRGLLTTIDHLASAGFERIGNPIPSIENRIQFSQLWSTQAQARRIKRDALLIAPTGTGKTEAAFLWVNANQYHKNTRRIFYFLPFMASINAMYRRLQDLFVGPSSHKTTADERRLSIGMLHSRALYFLSKFYHGAATNENELDPSENDSYSIHHELFLKQKRILHECYAQLKILTPYQMLKAMFGLKGFEQRLTELYHSLLIIDEIHVHDPKTSALILAMFKVLQQQFNANFLIMSATFPKFLRQKFQNYLHISQEITMHDKELRHICRHHLQIHDGTILDQVDRILKDVQRKKRVLITCNTVARAREVYSTLKKTLQEARATRKVNIGLLHGRFVLKDRERIESRIKHYHILVATQVVEVSLNISFDVLYTEPAPIDALIQRFGRINRFSIRPEQISFNSRPRCPKHVNIHIVTKGSDKDIYIYPNQSLVRKTIATLEATNPQLSEALVHHLIEEIYADGYDPRDERAFNETYHNALNYFSTLLPFHDYPHEEYHSLFDGYEVVPECFKDLALQHENNPLQQMKYFVTISTSYFKRAERRGLIERPCKGKFYVITDVPYDEERGLDDLPS